MVKGRGVGGYKSVLGCVIPVSTSMIEYGKEVFGAAKV